MTQALIETLLKGGCYWPADPTARTHSLAIPHGTHFKIALDGEASNRYVAGICLDGGFKVTEGNRAGTVFPSANAAVYAVRGTSTNAFLYIHFQIDGRWIKADSARETEVMRCDPVEERAFQIASELVKAKLSQSKRKVSEVDHLHRKIAEVVHNKPEIMNEARRRIEVVADLKDLEL